jgi:hypothetical protein
MMAIDPNLLAQVLGTADSRDVTGSPIVRAVILSNPDNVADLVPALDDHRTLAASNARTILCLFESNAVRPLLSALRMAGPRARQEGLEVLWALLVSEEPWTVRQSLESVKPDLYFLLDDTSPLHDDMPAYIERDFQGRICDLAFGIVQQLLDRKYDHSLFRSLDGTSRNEEIRRLKTRGFGLHIA